jgi:hypothetical protein
VQAHNRLHPTDQRPEPHFLAKNGPFRPLYNAFDKRCREVSKAGVGVKAKQADSLNVAQELVRMAE